MTTKKPYAPKLTPTTKKGSGGQDSKHIKPHRHLMRTHDHQTGHKKER